MHSDIRAAAAALGCNGKTLGDHKIQVTQCSPDEMNAFFVEGASLEVLANQICATDPTLSSAILAANQSAQTQQNHTLLNLNMGGVGCLNGMGGASLNAATSAIPSNLISSSSIPLSTAIFPVSLPSELSPLSAAAALQQGNSVTSSHHQVTSLMTSAGAMTSQLNLVTPPSSPPRAR